MSDFGKSVSQFTYEDLSKMKDKTKQKLNYYSGLDRIRNRMHGNSKIMLKQVDVMMYPKRKFNRYDAYIQLSLKDLWYSQRLYSQEFAIRNIWISK